MYSFKTIKIYIWRHIIHGRLMTKTGDFIYQHYEIHFFSPFNFCSVFRRFTSIYRSWEASFPRKVRQPRNLPNRLFGRDSWRPTRESTNAYTVTVRITHAIITLFNYTRRYLSRERDDLHTSVRPDKNDADGRPTITRII